jgi:hypothetical protein
VNQQDDYPISMAVTFEPSALTSIHAPGIMKCLRNHDSTFKYNSGLHSHIPFPSTLQNFLEFHFQHALNLPFSTVFNTICFTHFGLGTYSWTKVWSCTLLVRRGICRLRCTFQNGKGKKIVVCTSARSELYNSSLVFGISKRRVGDTSFALLFQKRM